MCREAEGAVGTGAGVPGKKREAIAATGLTALSARSSRGSAVAVRPLPSHSCAGKVEQRERKQCPTHLQRFADDRMLAVGACPCLW